MTKLVVTAIAIGILAQHGGQCPGQRQNLPALMLVRASRTSSTVTARNQPLAIAFATQACLCVFSPTPTRTL